MACIGLLVDIMEGFWGQEDFSPGLFRFGELILKGGG